MKRSTKPQTRVPADGEPGKYCVGPISGCSACSESGGRYLTLDSFHKNSKAPDGLKRRCRQCISDYQRDRWDRRPSQARSRLKSRRKTAGVRDSEARDAVQHYIETGEVLPLIDESLSGAMDEFLSGEDDA